MFKIILSLIFLIIWLIIQVIIQQVIMNKVPDNTVRQDIISFLFVLEAVIFMCGLFLGLVHC